MVQQKIILRAMLGWTSGIVLGMYGALMVIIIMPMNIYLKIFTVIGLFSASLGTLYSLYETYRQYKIVMAMEELSKPELDNLEDMIKEVNNNGITNKK
jgi:hypothetical protein